MEHRSPKRVHQNDVGEPESTPQKRAKRSAEETEDGKIEYKILCRSPSLDNNPSSDPERKDETSFQKPFGADKTSMSFPEKIMRILSFPEFADAIRWNPEGTDFYILPEAFTKNVLDPFTRKLNRFSFKRILDEDRYPKGTFAFRHEYFQRGREDLLKMIEIDSDKKQRRLSASSPASFNRNSSVREETKDEILLSSGLDTFAHQLSGGLSSPTTAAGFLVNQLPTQEELNRLQELQFRQQQQQQLTIPQRASLPDMRSSFNNPLLHASLPPSLYVHSSQVPLSDTAFLRDLSYRRQEQLTRALQQVPVPRPAAPAQPPNESRQRSIDPRLLYLLLSRQQQQGRRPSAPP